MHAAHHAPATALQHGKKRERERVGERGGEKRKTCTSAAVSSLSPKSDAVRPPTAVKGGGLATVALSGVGSGSGMSSSRSSKRPPPPPAGREVVGSLFVNSDAGASLHTHHIRRQLPDVEKMQNAK
jgi:hypothetical protein